MKNQLVIKALDIREMPGIPRGLESMQDFSANINIVAGANASGKSSTAKAIQHLLWQDGEISNKVRLSAEIEIEEEAYRVNLTGKLREVTRQGENVSFPITLPNESKQRYFLSLHELIRGEDSALAKIIMDQAVGGYDLKSAIDALKYKQPDNRALNPLGNQVNLAAKKVAEIKKKQHSLKQEEEKLIELEAEQIEATQAVNLAQLFAKLKDLRDEEKKLQEATLALNQFPDEITKLKDDDAENLKKWRNEKEQGTLKIKHLRDEIKRLISERDALHLPKEGVSSQFINELEELSGKLTNTEDEIQKATKELARLQVALNHSEAQLGEDVVRGLKDAQIPTLSEGNEKTWQELIESKALLLKQQAYVETLRDKISETKDAETLKKGIYALSKWLRVVSGEFAGISISLSLTLGGLILLTTLATYFIGAWGFVGVLLSGFMLYKMHQSEFKTNETLRNQYKKDYESTQLQSPNSWNIHDISTLLEKLADDLTHATTQLNLRDELKREENLLSELASKNDDLAQRVNLLRVQLCAIPALSEERLASPSSLYWHYHEIKKWQERLLEVEENKEQLLVLNNIFADLLDIIKLKLTNFSTQEIISTSQVKAAVKGLKEDAESWSKATRDIDSHERDIQRLNETIENLTEQQQEVFTRLNLSEQNEPLISELTLQLQAYRNAVQFKRDREGMVSNLRNQVDVAVAGTKYETTWERIPYEIILEKIVIYENEAKKLESIITDISRIKTLIQNTISDNALQEALTDLENEKSVLEGRFHEQARLIAGDLLAQQVQKSLGEKNMPDVFHKARTLFTSITRGRYELHIPSSEYLDFGAFDTNTNEIKSLDELSSGTRIQVLIAVRLAFIESAEGTKVKLPILADELLANSDSIRAEAIIEALTEISKLGRQIFYFTAQEDEAAKWQHYLKKHPQLKPAIFTLSSNFFNEDELNINSFLPLPKLSETIPSPKGETNESYREKLNIPPFNPLMDDVERLHLWYITENLEGLHGLLQSGISHYGAFRNFLNHKGKANGFSEDDIHQIHLNAELVQFYSELMRHGRDKPLGISQLPTNDIISDTFEPRIIALLEEVKGNPSHFIQALKDKRLKGFRKTDDLEAWLIENGFITEHEPYSDEEIKTQLTAWLSNSPLLMNDAEKLLSRIFSPHHKKES